MRLLQVVPIDPLFEKGVVNKFIEAHYQICNRVGNIAGSPQATHDPSPVFYLTKCKVLAIPFF